MSVSASPFLESRKQASQHLGRLTVPTIEQENYRFSPASKVNWNLSGNTSLAAMETPSQEEGELALLFVSGSTETLQGKPDCIFQGLASLKDLPISFSPRDPFSDDKYAQLSLADWCNGIYLHVPAGRKIELPLRALQEFRGEQANFRTIIDLGEDASVKLVDEYVGDARVVTGILQFHLAKNAVLEYSQVQRLSSQSQFFLRQDIQLAEGAKFEYTPLYLGASSGQLRSQTFLNGAAASFSVAGAARGSQSQHFDFWMDVNHLVPDTKSGIDGPQSCK